MDFSFSNSSWQAQNLPEGFSFCNGVLFGSHNIKGSYSVPITVTTPFGSDTKNITINVRARPGSEKFSILQNGVEIEQLTIPQLVASIRDGSALEKYNCTNTQLLIPVKIPPYDSRVLNFWYNLGVQTIPDYQFVPLNFCSFRDVTLLDGSVKNSLILQFDKSLWTSLAPFDFPDSNSGIFHNRWKFSSLRQWLNSSGFNWFVPAYEGDAMTDDLETKCYSMFIYSVPYFNEEKDDYEDIPVPCYDDDNVPGFLDLLPQDLSDAILQVRIVTQCL